MQLHWDLARRLMMGSKRDAATRMSALMALGLMGLTALGATLVVSGNKGLQNSLSESIAKTQSMPDGSLTVKFTSRTDQGNPDIQNSLSELLSDLERHVKSVDGDIIHFNSVHTVIVPKDNLNAIQKMWLDYDDSKTNSTIQTGNTRAQRIQARRDEAKEVANYYKHNAAMGVIHTESCVVPGHHPPEGQTWAIESNSLDSRLVPPRVGNNYSILVSPHKKGLSLPLIQTLTLSKVVERVDDIPPSCGWLVPPKTMENVSIRMPDVVYFRSVWWAEPEMDQFFAQHNLLEKSGIDREAYRQDWGETVISISGVFLKDYLVDGTMKEEITLEVIGMISWTVVGILATISAYQMCSLLILLGVHFNFEIAMVRSMGMSKLSVGLVFLMASCLFAGFAALMGAGLGVGIVYAYNQWFGVIASHFDLHGFIILDMPGMGFWLAMGVSVVVGVLSGLFPSFMAARSDPAVVWRDS